MSRTITNLLMYLPITVNTSDTMKFKCHRKINLK